MTPHTMAILGRAEQVIRRGWTRGASARGADGYGVGAAIAPHPRYMGAAKFCSSGAVVKAAYDELGWKTDSSTVDNEIGAAVLLFREANGIRSVPEWNDRWYRMKWQVVRAFRKAQNLISR